MLTLNMAHQTLRGTGMYSKLVSETEQPRRGLENTKGEKAVYMMYSRLSLNRWGLNICVDSSQTVLEHHRSFAPFISVLIAA